MRADRLDWPAIVRRAAEIVRGDDTGVTLRQLFYRLVAVEMLPNPTTAYKTPSSRTAEARRRGTFPALIDRTRGIHRQPSFSGPVDARQWVAGIYRRDRTEGQPWSVYLAVEKAGIVEQLQARFGKHGVSVLALGGYAAQTYADEVAADVERQGRPAVVLYAGDFDPSGEDIDPDFLARTGCFGRVQRVALTVCLPTLRPTCVMVSRRRRAYHGGSKAGSGWPCGPIPPTVRHGPRAREKVRRHDWKGRPLTAMARMVPHGWSG